MKKSNSIQSAIDQMFLVISQRNSLHILGYLLICTSYNCPSDIDEITALIISN